MCNVDNRTPCYHAAEPMPEAEVTVGALVSVPLWHAGNVLHWEPSMIKEVRAYGERTYIATTSRGDALYYPWSIGRPGTAGRS